MMMTTVTILLGTKCRAGAVVDTFYASHLLSHTSREREGERKVVFSLRRG